MLTNGTQGEPQAEGDLEGADNTPVVHENNQVINRTICTSHRLAKGLYCWEV